MLSLSIPLTFLTVAAGALNSGRVIDIDAQTIAALRDGQSIYVQSVKRRFLWNPTSTVTNDNTTAGTVVQPTAVGGAGRFVWDGVVDQSWFTGNQNYFISNLATSYEATGAVGDPLPTNAELNRRLPAILPAGSVCSVTYVNAPVATDPLFIPSISYLLNSSLTINGTRTITKSGTFQAVTAQNRGTQTPWDVTDAVGALGAADVGRIIRITGGARVGAYAVVAKNLGANKVRISPFGTFSATPGNCFTAVTPQVGDPYEVVTLTQVSVSSVNVNSLTNVKPTATTNGVFFDSIQLNGLNTTSDNIVGQITTGNGAAVFFKQSILNFMQFGGGGSTLTVESGINCAGCVFAGSVVALVGSASYIGGGCVIGGNGLLCYPGSVMAIDGDTLFQAASLQVDKNGYAFVGAAAFFDLVGAGSAPVDVFPGGLLLSNPINLGVDLLWGTANAAFGIKVRSMGRLCYVTKPTVNATLGAGRETQIGGVGTVYGAVPAITAANNAGIVLLA